MTNDSTYVKRLTVTEQQLQDCLVQIPMPTAKRLIHKLYRVRVALERVQAGSYGRCQSCDHPIQKERLDYLPYAEFCFACQRILERGC